MPTLSRRRLLAGAAATGAAFLTAPAFPSLAVGRFAGDPGAGRLHYGAVYDWRKSLPDWERRLGRHIGVNRTYFGSASVDSVVKRVRDDSLKGRLPHVSIKVPTTWTSVASGRNDAWLEGLLGRLKNERGPVFLTIHHEPENDVGGAGMQPSDWVAMQRRAIAKRREIGALNVSIVPVLMTWTFQSLSRRNPNDWMVPEATLFGLNSYNDWSPTNGRRWTTFGERIDHALPYVDGRPIVVGEYGCRTDRTRPGRAADWMDAAFQYAVTHNIVAMSYFNTPLHTPDVTWELDGEREPVFKWLLNSAKSVW
ncbi:hypothetical protein BH18ACT3_BH18ACT3_26970 [soil metagenome]